MPDAEISPREAAERFADHVAGTASMSNIEDILEQLELPPYADNSEFLQELDDKVFECDGCGWWCRTEEANDAPNGCGYLCDDCNEEEDDDE